MAFLLHSLSISTYFNNFLEIEYDVIRNYSLFCKLDLDTFIATFILEVLFYQIDSVFRQKKSATCNDNNNDMHSIFLE